MEYGENAKEKKIYTLSMHLPVTIAVGKHLASFFTVLLIWEYSNQNVLITEITMSKSNR